MCRSASLISNNFSRTTWIGPPPPPPPSSDCSSLQQLIFTIQDFYIHYQDSALYLGIYLPVAHAHFNLYKTDAYPLPLAANLPHTSIIRNPKPYLAVSDERMFYFYPSITDIQAFCTRNTPGLCHYQPALYSTDENACEYTIFDNSQTVPKELCKYDVTEETPVPSIAALNSSSYLITNVTDYTVQCQEYTYAHKGCQLCILAL